MNPEQITAWLSDEALLLLVCSIWYMVYNISACAANLLVVKFTTFRSSELLFSPFYVIVLMHEKRLIFHAFHVRMLSFMFLRCLRIVWILNGEGLDVVLHNNQQIIQAISGEWPAQQEYYQWNWPSMLILEFASSVPKGCKSGFVTYWHHVVQQAELQLVVKYCFWLVMFYPI